MENDIVDRINLSNLANRTIAIDNELINRIKQKHNFNFQSITTASTL